MSSVISDYTSNMPPVINSESVWMTRTFIIHFLPVGSMGQLRKVVRLTGSPWSQLETSEQITIKIIGVLADSGYTLSMPINIDADTRVYFFIRSAHGSVMESSDERCDRRF